MMFQAGSCFARRWGSHLYIFSFRVQGLDSRIINEGAFLLDLNSILSLSKPCLSVSSNHRTRD